MDLIEKNRLLVNGMKEIQKLGPVTEETSRHLAFCIGVAEGALYAVGEIDVDDQVLPVQEES